jgi:hypothetical protein
VVVSPEYNHSVPPALSNTLAHFGGSLFAFKPSAVVTYSSGGWANDACRAGAARREPPSFAPACGRALRPPARERRHPFHWPSYPAVPPAACMV